MNPSARTTRCAALTALALSSGALTACLGGWAGMGAAGAAGFGAAAVFAGPSVTLHNQSNVPLRVAYWVGEVDATAPTGVSNWRSDWDLNFVLPPADKDSRRVGHNGYNASTADSVVRVRIEPAPGEGPGPTIRPTQFAGAQTYWLELQGPPPYRLRVFGDEDELTFESYGEGGLRAVPQDQRFPFRNEAQPTPTNPYADR